MFEQISLPAWANKLASLEAYGISIRTAVIAFTILLFAMLARRIITKVIARGFLKLAARTEHEWDDDLIKALQTPLELLVVVWGIWAAARVLMLPLDDAGLVANLYEARNIAVIGLIGWGALKSVAVAETVLRQQANTSESLFDIGLVPVVVAAARILISLIFATIIAGTLGYSVTGLVASLGLGGAALALASRDAVANLFGFFMILLDRPFKVGDWIKGDGFEGMVEEIGFRSTRIRTFGKTVENIPNNVMANAYVENMDRRKDPGLNVRRVSMTVGVTYATTPEQMETIIAALRKMLADDPDVDSRMTTLVYFTEFGASSLDIFFYYFTCQADWAFYLDVRQRVNLSIMRILREHGLEIAFPSRSVYLETIPDGLGLPAGMNPGE
ncbi:MAG: MscS family membrane protein [Hyphomicrobiaceae bacterium]|jgi:MscS family membrane protein